MIISLTISSWFKNYNCFLFSENHDCVTVKQAECFGNQRLYLGFFSLLAQGMEKKLQKVFTIFSPVKYEHFLLR